MKIILLNQYYPPDIAPTGVMLKSVVNQLVEAGHEVTIFCAHGGYGDATNAGAEADDAPAPEGVSIVRIPALRLGRGSMMAKILDYASYYLGVALRLLTHKSDVVVALTTPPYLSVLARIGTKLRGGVHAHWVMDLYPDVMIAHGMLSEQSIAAKVLKKIAAFGFGGDRCSGVLTLGPDMKARVAAYVPEETRLDWVPLWSTTDIVADGPRSQSDLDVQSWRSDHGWSEQQVVFLYSGNMGLGHRFGEFLCATKNSPSGAHFVFTGGGRRKVEVETFIKDHDDLPLEAGDYVDMDDLSVHLASADVHLVSLEPCWDGTMVPSKIQGIFASGKPSIFIGSTSSSIGQWILESGAGWVVAPNDDKALAFAIDQCMDCAEREKRGKTAYSFSQKYFQSQCNAHQVAAFFAHNA